VSSRGCIGVSSRGRVDPLRRNSTTRSTGESGLIASRPASSATLSSSSEIRWVVNGLAPRRKQQLAHHRVELRSWHEHGFAEARDWDLLAVDPLAYRPLGAAEDLGNLADSVERTLYVHVCTSVCILFT